VSFEFAFLMLGLVLTFAGTVGGAVSLLADSFGYAPRPLGDKTSVILFGLAGFGMFILALIIIGFV